ncbi:unnamed protein product, partial [Larinioides sclopetarius]
MDIKLIWFSTRGIIRYFKLCTIHGVWFAPEVHIEGKQLVMAEIIDEQKKNCIMDLAMYRNVVVFDASINDLGKDLKGATHVLSKNVEVSSVHVL